MFKNKKLLIAVSIIIPIVVSVLIGMREPLIPNMPLKFLPSIYATLNGITAVVLILALIFIKQGKRVLHERMMNTAIALSITFLLMYVAYHITTPTTPHPRDEVFIYYLIILLSHIVLSAAVIPLVLFSLYYAKTDNFVKHKRLVRWAYPIWLYVAITGVIIYLMISPHYVD